MLINTVAPWRTQTDERVTTVKWLTRDVTKG